MPVESSLNITFITCFPEMFPGCLGYSLAASARKNNIWQYEIINLRDFGISKHQNIDDIQYGGGSGLVIRADVLGPAIDKALEINNNAQIYYMSPRGKLLKQAELAPIIDNKNIIIICGRYEGIDERIIDEYNVAQISIGDYILSGGEIAAQVLADACIRLLPGVMSNQQETLKEESFTLTANEQKLLEYPLYTRPAIWKERAVPEILLSGNHNKIANWRLDKAIEITKKARPDLLKN